MKALWLTERFFCDIISLNGEMMKRVDGQEVVKWKRISMGHVEARSISIRVTVAVIMTIMSRLAAADMTIMNTSMAAAAVMTIMSRSMAAAAAVPVAMTMETMDRIRRNCCV